MSESSIWADLYAKAPEALVEIQRATSPVMHFKVTIRNGAAKAITASSVSRVSALGMAVDDLPGTKRTRKPREVKPVVADDQTEAFPELDERFVDEGGEA